MLLSGFPREIIEQIANYLSFRDKTSCSLVCKSWKRVFQDTLYSDISILSYDALKNVMTPSQDNRHKYHEIGHLVRYLTISENFHATAKQIYALQKTFPNIKYLYFAIAPLRSNNFGNKTDWNLWRSLTELRMDIYGSYKHIMENLLVEAIACLPLLKRLSIHNKTEYNIIIEFSVNNFETIHSHLKHLEYMKLRTGFLTLSDTDLERIPNVSPATTMKILDIIPNDADYRWLCYFSHKYPNLNTLNLGVKYLLPDTEVQRHNTMTLFQQVPASFQHLESFNLKYSQNIERKKLIFMDKICFHDAPLKHVSIDVLVRYGASPDNLCDTSKIIAETFLERCSKTIESLNLKCDSRYATPINLTGIENSLCNLVKVNMSVRTVADIDTFLRAAPRLKYLQLECSNIKIRKQLYNSERFELQSFDLRRSKITSNVLRFLSFHCRKLDTLNLNYTWVYGSFTTPGCQSIDMTYSRLQSLSINKIRFIIEDNKKCPDNLNITLITRPVDAITPKQEYDPDIFPVNVGDTPFKTHNEWFYENDPGRMIRISGLQASYTEDFFSNYEENKRIATEENERIAMKENRRITRQKAFEISKQNFVFGYTKISLGYVFHYSHQLFFS
ncbi:hypothetical protein CLU79DRAFT_152665 [Phycomyces nitens]|nr:hypothetical protein CLU79DRAFT_152665 [Phycomyces nitens]